MEPIKESDSLRTHGRRWMAIALAGVLLAGGAGGTWLYSRASRSADRGESDAGGTYYCPMHPSFKSDQPGNCPICSMKLVPLEATSTAPDATAPPAAASAGAAASIRIAPERQQVIGVKFATAELLPASVEIRAVGKVAYDETQITHVHTKVSGWIDDVFVDFVGASVRKGQPLFTLYSPDLVASQEEYLLALRARDELGGSSFSRVAEGSRSLVEQARRRLELWDLTPDQIDSLERAGKVSRTVTIHSPVGGVVLERAAYHHGRTVTPELDLYTIVELSRVWVLAQVYEYELPHVAVGQAAKATLPYDPERKPLRGKVTFVYPFLDPMTRTVQVRMEFPNRDLALKPDAFVNVTLKRDMGRRLLVPKDAVMDTGTTQYVFVDKGDGYLEPREVKAGAEVAEGRIIAEGLAEGERVVTAANFILDSESRLKGAIDAMGRPVPVEAQASPTAASLAIQVQTDPSPARIGKNQVRVNVADAQGQPIVDAEVSVRLFMPQMVSMAQVDVRATLRPAAPGEYVGEVEIPIAWTFSTTVTVRKAGQVLGTAETSITAR
jgi:RND family efflux transporter MFP subunit